MQDDEAWWTETGEATAEDGTPLVFHAGGPKDGRAIVCCNGVGVSTFFWKYLAKHFTRTHRVVVWDYRGHGESGRARQPDSITMEGLARDLRNIMNAAGIQRAVLTGHSMGCQVILETWHQFPERVLGLVPMLGTYGRPADTFLDPRVGRKIFDFAYEHGRRVPEQVNTLLKHVLRKRPAFHFARFTGLIHTNLARKDDLDPYLEHISQVDVRIFLEMARAAQDHDAGPFLGDITAPTLVVAGERDLFTPRNLSLEMARRIPGAELLEIPSGSHAALIEQPELINLRLEKFIRTSVVPYEAATAPLETPGQPPAAPRA